MGLAQAGQSKAAPKPRTPPRIEAKGGSQAQGEKPKTKAPRTESTGKTQDAKPGAKAEPAAKPKARMESAGSQKGKGDKGAAGKPQDKPPVAIPRAPTVRSPGESQDSKAKADPNRPDAAVRVARKRAVRRALEWLRTHQRKDGSIGEEAKHRVATTALATLAFFASGSTQHDGRYAPSIKKAVAWLRSQQADENDVKEKAFVGLIGVRSSHSFHYGHAIATWALIEARQRGDDKTLDEPIANALIYISRARNPYKVWRYYPRDGDNDSSVTAWMTTVLRRARDTGVLPEEMRDSLKYAEAWYEEVTNPNDGRCGYTKRGERPARNVKSAHAWPATASESLTALGLAIRLEDGAKLAKKPILFKSIACLNESPPRWDKARGTTDLYYWYWGARAYAHAPQRLKAWRDQLVDTLLPQQQDNGSWPSESVWGSDGGPVYSTSLAAMSLLYATHKSRL